MYCRSVSNKRIYCIWEQPYSRSCSCLETCGLEGELHNVLLCSTESTVYVSDERVASEKLCTRLKEGGWLFVDIATKALPTQSNKSNNMKKQATKNLTLLLFYLNFCGCFVVFFFPHGHLLLFSPTLFRLFSYVDIFKSDAVRRLKKKSK